MRFSSLAMRLSIASLVLLAAPAFAQTATTRMQLTTASPSRVGQPVTLTAEVDSLGVGAATGIVSFADGASVKGTVALGAPAGAGQATLSSGERHTCALFANGGVRCWGYNYYGQLGDGTLISRPTGAFVAGLTGGVVAVAAGSGHTCALTTIGAVKCWGYNGYGQLGDGTTTNSMTPVQVAGLTSGVVAIAVGDSHSCALGADGVVKCWGYNGYDQLGNGGNGSSYTPVLVGGPATTYTAIAAGWRHTCALTSAGGVKCWGANYSGELGDGTGASRRLPVQVFNLASGVVAITADGDHSCAVTATGALKCWGENNYGQIGDGSQTDRLAPVQVSGLTSGVVAADAGGGHTCALLSNGSVRCWGRNYDGQLGDGSTTSRLTPWPVTSVGVAVALSSGGDHSCAQLLNRFMRCWGDNYYGQIGDATNTDRYLPATSVGFLGLLRTRARLVTTLGAGWHLLRASYAGDAGHGAAVDIIGHEVQ